MPNKHSKVFNEENTIEAMIIKTLEKNGWKYVSSDDLDRPYSSVLVEPMVKEALIRLNPIIAEDPSRADEVIRKLRTIILTAESNSLITANEAFKKALFENNSYPFGANGRGVTVNFFGTLTEEELSKNEYIVTNQWIYPQEKGGKRFDIVLLVNGFPLVIGETKSPVRNASSWLDAALDIEKYEKSVPRMFVPNVFSFATEGKMYRYGTVNMPLTLWGPWHPNGKKKEGTLADVQKSIASMLKPEVVMDIFQFFTLYSTDNNFRKYKIICRYQQYEGANKIVDRVLRGYPKKGLIWHFQGSGKSLLMIFAANKLRAIPELKNPTVVIVDDRVDLEDKITSDFNSENIPNLQSAGSGEELQKFFESDIRKILITTIFKFKDVKGELNNRDNIILLVDEAHRTQEGNLGEKMREALPNAFFFGLTGTPINRIDKNTFKTFGAIEDRAGYMSKYSYSDSIRDGATLPLNFEAVPIELKIDKEKLDEDFDLLAEENELSEKEKNQLAKKVNMEAIMHNSQRIQKVCQHIAKHFKEKVEPNGFKGQVVVYDRECCLMYKKELDKLLGEEASTIVMTTGDDKEDKYKAYRRDRDQETAVLNEFRDPDSPLKLLIVTSKLLTGFDAPVLQTMYLDKPMKDHTLLQAVCRTNRTYGNGKTNGLIVDYIGIFDNVARAFNFDEKSVKKIITNIDESKKQFPKLMEKCISHFPGVDRTLTGFEALEAAQACVPDNKTRDLFAADYQVVIRVWNALSPDLFLNEFRADYKWLSMVYESVRPTDQSGALLWTALGPKTMDLVNSHIEAGEADESVEIIELTPEMIDKLMQNPTDDERTRIRVEIDLVARIRKHSSDPKYIRLGEKLEELKIQHEQGLLTSIEFLKYILELAKEAAEAEKEVVPEEEIDKGKAALTELFNGVKNKNTPVIVERIVADIDNIVRVVRFEGWQNSYEGVRQVRKAIREIIWKDYQIKDREVYEKACSYVAEYY